LSESSFMKNSLQRKWKNLTSLISKDAVELLTANGTELVKKIGIDMVRGGILDVLVGKNLRDSTETLTRKRIATLNLAILEMFLQAANKNQNFVEELSTFASSKLCAKKISRQERWLAQWILGLTDKAFQNVLRDEQDAIVHYAEQYKKSCKEIAASFEQTRGRLKGVLSITPDIEAEVDLIFMVYLLNTIGSETLSIRGSEKSAYGKLFEKLILGSLLSILGFKFVDPQNPGKPDKIFWLSQQSERRESDATLLYTAGKGVRFDIGFIGRGNPEISLDKVTRFEKEIELNSKKWYLATIIIVDRIGRNSRIEELAKRVGGTIVQMSMSYWPRQVAAELYNSIGYSHELVKLPDSKVEDYLKKEIAKVPITEFIGLQKDFQEKDR
jgi:hypothetical protein